MFDYLKTTVGKTISDALISLAGYVGGYSLVNPNDKHGVKSSKLLCKGKVICIPFYHSGHCCQVYLNYDRTNFEEVVYGVLFPDGKIIDISTGCPGMGEPTVKPEMFGLNCQLIYSTTVDSFPEHIEMLNTDDYFFYGTEDTVVQDEVDEKVDDNIHEYIFNERTVEEMVEEMAEEMMGDTVVQDEVDEKVDDNIHEYIFNERTVEEMVEEMMEEMEEIIGCKFDWQPSPMSPTEYNFRADSEPEENTDENIHEHTFTRQIVHDLVEDLAYNE